MSIPAPVAPTSTLRLHSGDATLHGEWFAPPQGRWNGAVVVVTHGFAEHCGRYREVAAALHGAGAAVLTYDCRGHGRSTGRRGYCRRFAEFLDDLQAAIDQARACSAEAGLADPAVVLLGHSHGGLIVLRALTDTTRDLGVRAAVLSSPFLALKLKVGKPKELAARVFARVWPTLAMPAGLRIEQLTHDEGKLAERRADTLCHDVATPGWFAAADAAQAEVLADAARVKVPTLWLVAEGDEIVDPARSRAVADRIAAAPVDYRGLPGLKHEVLNERSRAELYGALTRFVDAHVAR